MDPRIEHKNVLDLLKAHPEGLLTTEITNHCEELNSNKVVKIVTKLTEAGVMIWETTDGEGARGPVRYGILGNESEN